MRHIHARIHVGKVTALGVLCCFALFVCLTLLASFFLPSPLSFKNMYVKETRKAVYSKTYIHVARVKFSPHIGKVLLSASAGHKPC